MQSRNDKKSRYGREQTSRDCDAAMQFIHATNPYRHASHPKQTRQQREQCNNRPHRNRPVFVMRQQPAFADKRCNHGNPTPGVHFNFRAKGIKFPRCKLFRNVWFVIHNETKCKASLSHVKHSLQRNLRHAHCAIAFSTVPLRHEWHSFGFLRWMGGTSFRPLFPVCLWLFRELAWFGIVFALRSSAV